MREKEETITITIIQVILKLKHWINITLKETNTFISNIKYIKKQKTDRNKKSSYEEWRLREILYRNNKESKL